MEESRLCMMCCCSFTQETATTDFSTNLLTKSHFRQFCTAMECSFVERKLEDEEREEVLVNGDLNLDYRKVSVCSDCLNQISATNVVRDEMSYVEGRVLSLQKQVLEALDELQRFVDQFYEKMKGLENIIKVSDKPCLCTYMDKHISTERTQDVLLFRQKILDALIDLPKFQHQLAAKTHCQNSGKEIKKETLDVYQHEHAYSDHEDDDASHHSGDTLSFPLTNATTSCGLSPRILPTQVVRIRSPNYVADAVRETDSKILDNEDRSHIMQMSVEKVKKRLSMNIEKQHPSRRRLKKKQKHDEIPCPTCGKVFGTMHLLRLHDERMHQQRERVVCSKCGKMLLPGPSVRYHDVACTKRDPEDIHECHVCRKTYQNKFNLRKHLRVYHPTTGPSKPHLCSTCGKSFAAKVNLTKHLASHSDDRPFACLVCNNACYKTKEHLRRHKKTCNKSGNTLQNISL